MNKMLNFVYLVKENIFAFSLSIIIHAMILSLLIYNIDTLKQMMTANIKQEEIIDNGSFDMVNYVTLVDTFEEETEDYVEENTRFVSDRNVQSSGEPDIMPNLIPNLFKPQIDQSEQQNSAQKQEQIEEANDIIKFIESDHGDMEIERPETAEGSTTDKKIPSTFNEASDRAIIFSAETGKMRLGTRALPYYWYFKGLVSGISRMWNYTIPNQAHYLGLIQSDEVELLLSIDENGNVEFVYFLKQSKLGQSSLNSSCQKAVEYTGNIGVPPTALFEEYQENGKIYIPFRFIYQNHKKR